MKKKARIITVTNQKGGTGKSTTVDSISSGLTLKGYKVLAIDFDSQGNLSLFNGIFEEPDNTISEVLLEELPIRESIISSGRYNLIPSGSSLSTIDSKIYKDSLKTALEPITAEYDFIIIDTPPALSSLTINSLMACNEVIAVATPSKADIQGTKNLLETIEIMKGYNKGLKVKGILLTHFKKNTTVHKDLREGISALAGEYKTKVFNSTIRDSVAIQEAQATAMDIFSYKKNSPIAKDYEALIEELL